MQKREALEASVLMDAKLENTTTEARREWKRKKKHMTREIVREKAKESYCDDDGDNNIWLNQKKKNICWFY